jgi:tetratricopeptide (TPR) repeat protein
MSIIRYITTGVAVGSGVLTFETAQAQQQEIRLADEYFQKGEYDKAKAVYQKLARNNETSSRIHKNYLETLKNLQAWDEAEKFMKREIKTNPENTVYKIEYGLLQEKQGKANEATKSFERTIEETKENNARVLEASQFFMENGKADWAEKLFVEARKKSGDKTAYAFQLAQLYRMSNNMEGMLDEYLTVAMENKENLLAVQNALQDDIAQPEDFEKLEKVLIMRIQREPGERVYTDLLVWYYIQQKEFRKAFFQARAVDKRQKLEGQKVIEIGQISLQNKDYKSAAEIFEYLVKEYPQSINYPLNRRFLIQAKEELVKNSFPVSQESIRSLISDYQRLLAEVGRTPKTAEALRNMGLLYGFYLDEKDTAISILQEAMKMNRTDQRFVAKTKIDLGDIYLLKGEPWEATLLYSQTEKDLKEDPLGHEAKLRNAKLSYYKGEFKLAQEHLDILKLATSREIANDAMDLSILIQDNIGLDSTGEAMRAYAAVDLLLFKQRDDEALRQLDALLTKYPNHSLTDEVWWQKAQIYIRRNENQPAVAELEKIVTKYNYDILSDDAHFLIAKLLEEKLGQRDKAMEMYRDHLTKYPGSIYVAEARKRFRGLRGDNPN